MVKSVFCLEIIFYYKLIQIKLVRKYYTCYNYEMCNSNERVLRMSNNIITIYGEVPELIEKKASEMIDKYLVKSKNEFNFIKYNLYESDLASIIEESLTMPLFSDKKVVLVQNSYVFTGEKETKEHNHNIDQNMKDIEKYNGESLIIIEVNHAKL